MTNFYISFRITLDYQLIKFDMEGDKQFLEFIVKGLVDHPDDVKIDRKVDEMGVLLTLTVHPEDMGRVIGKSGNTANAIRTLLKVVGLKNNARVNFKINETGSGGNRNKVSSADQDTVDEAMEELKKEE